MTTPGFPVLPTRLIEVATATARLGRLVAKTLARISSDSAAPREVVLTDSGDWLITTSSPVHTTAIYIELLRQGEDAHLESQTSVRVTAW